MKPEDKTKRFHQFEWWRIKFFEYNESSFESFKKVIRETSKQNEDELINLFIQFKTRERVKIDGVIYFSNNAMYNGTKEAKLLNISTHYPKYIEIKGEDIAGHYYYKINPDNFLAIYEEMRKVCGYSNKKTVKKLRQKYNKAEEKFK